MKKTLSLLSSIAFLSLSIQSMTPAQATDLNLFGPGGRIHGADISRWQHPNDKAIDFQKMHAAGIAFVMIKASDTRDDADLLSVKYLKMEISIVRNVVVLYVMMISLYLKDLMKILISI